MQYKLSRIGFISKLNGYKGEVVLIAENITFSSLIKNKFIFIEIDGIAVPFAVEDLFEKSGTIILKFQDVNDSDYAKRFLGNVAFIETKGRKKKVDITLADAIAGYELIDKQYGTVGVIEKIEEYPQQLIATCRVKDKEVLIPLNDTFIEKIDDDEKKVFVDLPEGLLDIYLQ